MAGTGSLLVLLVLRALLAGAGQISLPWMLGEASHASLEPDSGGAVPDGAGLSLPGVATARRRAESALQKFARAVTTPLSVRRLSSSSLLYCVALEECAALFALVLLDAMHLDTRWLHANFGFSTVALLLLIVLALPLDACWMVCTAHGGGLGRGGGSALVRGRVAAVLALFLVWMYAFVRVPLPATVTPATRGVLGSVLARTATIGVTLIGALSGNAAAGAICDSYESHTMRRAPRETDVAAATASFRRACADLASRQATAEELQREVELEAPRTVWARLWSRSSREQQLASLQTEIAGLEAMASAMRDDLAQLEEQERHIRYAHTLPGRVMLLGGYLFSAYCAFRIVLSLLNLLVLGYRDTAPPDFVSLALVYAVRLLGIDLDVAAWAPQISLLFVGGLIFVRMRVVLNTVSALIRKVSTGVSTNLLVLFSAQVLCIYTLATLIQLRATLPLRGGGTGSEPPGAGAGAGAGGAAGARESVLARLPAFQVVFGALFDGTFLGAAVLTGAVRSFFWYRDAAYTALD